MDNNTNEIKRWTAKRKVDTSKNLRFESRPRRSGIEKRIYLKGLVIIAEAVSTTGLAKDGVFRGVQVQVVVDILKGGRVK